MFVQVINIIPVLLSDMDILCFTHRFIDFDLTDIYMYPASVDLKETNQIYVMSVNAHAQSWI